MANLIWEIEPIDYDLCVEWAISRRSDSHKRNYLIKIQGKISGEFAPNIHFGETHEVIEKQILKFKSKSELLNTLESSLNFCSFERGENNYFNSFLAGIEMASINYFDSFNQFFGKSSNFCKSSMSVPIISFEGFKNYFNQMRLGEFEIIKIKANENLPIEIIEYILDHTRAFISVDYNEAITSMEKAKEHLTYLSKIKRLKYIEQPFSAKNKNLYLELKKITQIPIFLDETITKQSIPNDITEFCDGINFKVMKSGGPLNTLEQIKMARSLNLKCMLGCMVESSLSMAMYVKMSHLVDFCDLDGSLFLKQDPFKMIEVKNGIVMI